ncbi:MAG: hypothetical protein WDZ52_09215 [Pseudohongiellaceae bacterium]
MGKYLRCAFFAIAASLTIVGNSRAQVNTLPLLGGSEIFPNEHGNAEARDLTVLAQTLSTEEIDRAVLNRLMREINGDPQNTKARLELEDHQLGGCRT